MSLQNQSSFHFCHYLGGQALWQYWFFELIPKACPQKCQELPGYFGWQHEFESDMISCSFRGETQVSNPTTLLQCSCLIWADYCKCTYFLKSIPKITYLCSQLSNIELTTVAKQEQFIVFGRDRTVVPNPTRMLRAPSLKLAKIFTISKNSIVSSSI